MRCHPRPRRLLAFLLLVLLSGFDLRAQTVRPVSPEAVGMSADRLARIDHILRPYAENDRVGGVAALVFRRGAVVHAAQFGLRDREAGLPLTPDTIFRIYSMTKPITSVAVLILMEQGRLDLADPVARFIPGFDTLKVYDPDVDGARRAAAHRPVTIHDLLTHTSGLTYGFFGNTPVDSLYRAADLFDTDQTLETFTGKLTTLPLLFQPGTRWNYSVATDVLGRVVEVASGRPFDVFLNEHVFEPLGMVDTGFDVPPEKLPRFAVNYQADDTGALEIADGGASSQYARPPRFQSGGGGLVSTQADYLRFARMLLGGGEVDGVRILGTKTVELMTMDHLDAEQEPGWGFGLGVNVCTDVARTQMPGSAGVYGWSGLANTHFFVDPEEELIAMVWTQLFPYGRYPIDREFRTAVYQAIID